MIETAPMTNLALLLKVFPEIKNKIRKIVFTGGAAKAETSHRQRNSTSTQIRRRQRSYSIPESH